MSQNIKFYSDQILHLKDARTFAQGQNRLCFAHSDDGLCIKVVKAGSIKALRAKRSFFKNLRPDYYFDDNLNEYKAYQQNAITNGGEGVFDHIPRCYGWQKTDIGMGLVLDYFKLPSGAPCETLETYLHRDGLTADIEEKLNTLAHYLCTTQLMTKNILPHNVVIADDGRLKIIDGIGASSAFSVACFSKKARKHYVDRRIQKMFLRARWESGDKAKSWTQTEKENR